MAGESFLPLLTPTLSVLLGHMLCSTQPCGSFASRSLTNSGLLFAGRLADLFGRKWLYLGGLSTFCVFSIISAVIKASQGHDLC
jgi:MFS family permease